MQRVNKNSSFHIQQLPPTSAAAKYHSYRAYFAVQEWLGNPGDLDPTDWGWIIESGELLMPIKSDKPYAPEKLIKIVSCACKQGCTRRCSCVKASLLYM